MARDCASNDDVTLWTIQSVARWDELQHRGVLPPAWPPAPEICYAEWCRAFTWMTEQMRERDITIEPGSGPWWAWFAYRFTANSKRPDLRSSRLLESGTSAVRIRLSAPPGEVLLSQFLMWEYVLLGQYTWLSHDELNRIEKSNPSQADTEQSWHRIFDLEAGDPDLWEPLDRRPIQACLGRIELSWVREVDMFVAR
jgi:hypothetical protein